MHNRILTRTAFNLPADPWASVSLYTADQARVLPMVRGAAEQQMVVTVLGQRGIGKTYAIHHALSTIPSTRVVEVMRLTREKTHMGDMEDALVRELSTESPRRSGEARTRQLRRILGQASETKNIVLVIDDAHVLHANTKRALKRLWEMRFANRQHLLGIVLIAQNDPLHGAAVQEVALRADGLWLQGLTSGEATSALQRALGNALDPDARHALAEANTGKTWLDLQEAADLTLQAALVAGHQTATLQDVAQATGAGLRELVKQSGLSQAQIAREIGTSDTTLSRILSGDRHDPDLQAKITEHLTQQAPQRAVGGAA